MPYSSFLCWQTRCDERAISVSRLLTILAFAKSSSITVCPHEIDDFVLNNGTRETDFLRQDLRGLRPTIESIVGMAGLEKDSQGIS